MKNSLKKSSSSSTNTTEEVSTSQCMDVFLFEVTKSSKGDPKLSKTASVIHDVSIKATLFEL